VKGKEEQKKERKEEKEKNEKNVMFWPPMVAAFLQKGTSGWAATSRD